ncbi:hypothetical protein [Gemmata massiliana]|uniref:hypothetical protein n=1 Tax=Gemmata massiliana TaxID=1210884 RepID=UPI0013A69C00|nr:hypothetical protein [Gemmata massiliana]
MCPYRQAVYEWDERTGSRCRALPYTFGPGCPSTVSSPTRVTTPSGTTWSSRNRAKARPSASPDRGARNTLATVRRPVVRITPTKSVEARWYVGLVKWKARTCTKPCASGGKIMAAVGEGRGSPATLMLPHHGRS